MSDMLNNSKMTTQMGGRVVVGLVCVLAVFIVYYLYVVRSHVNSVDKKPNEPMNLQIVSLSSSSSLPNITLQQQLQNPKYLNKESSTTNNMRQTKPTVNSMDDLLNPMQYSLVNYFILSSYNSCIYEIYTDKTTIVSLQALGNVLTNGYRLLDFELYLDIKKSIPIVASSYTTWSTNGTYATPIINTTIPLTFTEVMDYVLTNAFRPGLCSNSTDPLILNLRINTYDTSIYSKIADILKYYISKYPGMFLPKAFSYYELVRHKYRSSTNNVKNVLTLPIGVLNSHILIFASALNDSYLDSDISKYINNVPTTSNSGTASINPIVNINPISQFNLDDQLINYNKFNLSITYPDNYVTNNIDIDTLITKPKDENNNDIDVLNSYGIHCIGVMHYNKDSNYYKIINWFNKKTTAFVLKDKSLRDIQKVVNIKPQDPNYSFKPVDFKIQGINQKLDI
jgi:hypothetical protein